MRCTKCGEKLDENDIEGIHFRGMFERHYAYLCKKCGHIIGFSSNAGPR